MTQNLSKLCKSCNGVCCKIFCLPASRKQIFLDFINSFRKRKKSERLARRLDLLIMLLFFHHPQKLIVEHAEVKNSYAGRYVYKCLALSRSNRCLIYRLRPKLCRIYDCNGEEQIAHSVLNLPRLNMLLSDNENSGKVELKEEETCMKTFS